MADADGGAVPVDPYEAVLADLRAKRDEIQAVIATLEAFRSGQHVVGGTAATSAANTSKAASSSEGLGPGAFLGMSIVDATKKFLSHKRQQQTNTEILAALKAGGVVMKAADPLNVVGSVLTRRFNETGDVVRVGRGTWGLKEWYPNRSFNKEPSPIEAPGPVKEPPVVGHPKGEAPPVPPIDVFE